MAAADAIWWAVLVFSLAYWLFYAIAVTRVVRALPRIAAVVPGARDTWPKVSHVVPACNEANALRSAVTSRLQEGYPNAEFILIDDRSTDDTGRILDEIAAGEDHVRVLHIDELPEGWLGKVHALHRGSQLANGDWLLFSDADVHIAPGTLRRAIAYADEQGLDHVCVLPDLWPATPLLDVVLAMFLRTFALLLRPRALADPGSRAAIGVGAFNLVRRSALERTPGFEGVRLDVVDDLALGQMLKDHDARSGVLAGQGFVGLQWYTSLGDMARGAEKAALASFARFSMVRLVAICLLVLVLEVGPFVGVFAAYGWLLKGIALTGVGCAVVAQLVPSIAFGRAWWPAVFVPVATVLSSWMLLRAGLLAVWRGGMRWRGTLYPTEVLRRGARLRFP